MKSIHWVIAVFFKARNEEKEGEKKGRREDWRKSDLVGSGSGVWSLFFFFSASIDNSEAALTNGNTIQATNVIKIIYNSSHIF